MTIKPDLSVIAPATFAKVHMVGIGGSGMSGIARLLLGAGHSVTGSDVCDSPSIVTLRELGARITIGHDAELLGEVDLVVVTGAIWPDNPEYLEAMRRGIPILHRSQALVSLVADKRLVSVAGAHGKTTSTGMIVTALRELGAEPSFVNGGVIANYGLSAATGSGEFAVVEADESDGSFLLYDTSVALVTNVDVDHIDHFGSKEAFEEAFVTFAAAARELVVISADDPGAIRVSQRLQHPRVITFGESELAMVRVYDIVAGNQVDYLVEYEQQVFRGTLRVSGRHNAINAAGAFAVLIGLGFKPQPILDGIAVFAGTARRFELRGVVNGVSVYDDYAHHPTEVVATLSAARTVLGSGRIIAVHQPHLYSRTRVFAGEFAQVFESYAEHTVVLDVFGAREDPEPGVTGALVSERFQNPSKVSFVPDWSAAAVRVAQIARPGDFVITLGCGDVYRIVPSLLAALDGARS